MYMSLSDLRKKFIDDPQFAVQFVSDAKEVLTNVYGEEAAEAKLDILDNAGGKVDETKLYGNNDLLHTYVEAVKEMTVATNAQGKARLYSYLHSPWNEPEFTVDTNTRVITVPNEFSKNGVGVLGDHLAEILFFRLPRFYDVVDLYTVTSTSIYWYNSGKKTNYYRNPPVIIYAEDEELVLGWAISELATVAAGTVEFFIQFENVIDDPDSEHNGEVNFRLVTQPAKLTIKPTLELDKDSVEIEQYNDVVYSRAIYTPIINTLTASPARILEDLPEGQVDFDPETNNIVLSVDAVSPDNGTLLYHWNWNGVMVDQPEGNIINSPALTKVITYELANNKEIVFSKPAYGTETSAAVEDSYVAIVDAGNVSPVEQGWYELVEDEYVLTEDESVAEGKTYYEFVPGHEATVTPADGTTYRKLQTNVPGIYQVYVGNQTANGGIRYVYSKITIIEDAHDIVVNSTRLPGLAYLDKDSSAMTVSVDDANGTITYKWHHVDAITGEDTIVEGATGATYDPSNNNTITTDGSLRGYYYAEAINTKNNTVKHAYSERVEIEIEPVQIPKEDLTLVRDTNDGNVFTVSVANIPYPTATYQMYATITAYSGQGGIMTGTTYEVLDAKQTFAGNTASFSIANVTQLRDGQEFDINVYVVPVMKLGDKTYQRYAEGIDVYGNKVTAYTLVELKELFK